MQILLALTILVTLALLGSSKRFYAWRRSRLGAALTTGGWLFVMLGYVAGPHGMGLILPDQLIAVQPLFHFCLGWVGLLIGLQLDRRLPALLPAGAWRLTLLDAAICPLLVCAGALVVMLGLGYGVWPSAPVACVLAITALGWPAEVRALRRSAGNTEPTAAAIRASAGLLGIGAVVAFGFAFNAFDVTGDTAVKWTGLRALTHMAIAIVIGALMGLLGKWLFTVADRGASQFLLVLLGLTVLTSGTAVAMGDSPIFVALCAGAVICNFPSGVLDPLKRAILDAEQPIAMLLMLVAGVLMDPAIGSTGALLLLLGIAARGLAKTIVGRIGLTSDKRDDGHGALTATTLMIRQSPVAIALAVGYALSAYADAALPVDGARVLTLVILIGLSGEAWTLLRGPRAGKPVAEADSNPTDPTPEAQP